MLLDEHGGVSHQQPGLGRAQGGDIYGLSPDIVLPKGPRLISQVGASTIVPQRNARSVLSHMGGTGKRGVTPIQAR